MVSHEYLNASFAAADESSIPLYGGYISCVVAVILFGSNFVPVKKFETGDGMFFQWIVCWAVWITGLVIHLVTMESTYIKFYPLAMLGGFLWATGNICVVPIIKTIGLGQGILVWGSFNLLSGWVTGRFGLLGLKAEVPNNTTLNYIGMGLCTLSTFIYIFIKTESQSRVDNPQPITDPLLNRDEDDPLLTAASIETHEYEPVVKITYEKESFIDKLSPVKKRIIGISLSVFSGLLYGLNFTPVIYIQDNYPEASQKGLDYVFAHWCGIFITSTAYFLIYCAFMRNVPQVYPKVILPGFVAGVLWAVADAAWFIANEVLSEAVSFPIITTGPGVIAALWGVFFKEIRGWRNLLLLCCAMAITLTGGILTGLSKS